MGISSVAGRQFAGDEGRGCLYSFSDVSRITRRPSHVAADPEEFARDRGAAAGGRCAIARHPKNNGVRRHLFVLPRAARSETAARFLSRPVPHFSTRCPGSIETGYPVLQPLRLRTSAITPASSIWPKLTASPSRAAAGLEAAAPARSRSFSGEVDYIEKCDFETERGTRLTCIGAPESDLVLDA